MWDFQGGFPRQTPLQSNSATTLLMNHHAIGRLPSGFNLDETTLSLTHLASWQQNRSSSKVLFHFSFLTHDFVLCKGKEISNVDTKI